MSSLFDRIADLSFPGRILPGLFKNGDYVLFRKEDAAFVILERHGKRRDAFYSFLEEQPASWASVFKDGVCRVKETAEGILYVAVDALPDPRYLICARIEDLFNHAALLRFALCHDILHLEKQCDIPVWFDNLIATALAANSPLLLVAEPGSGMSEFVSAFLERKFGTDAGGIFFHPGRLSRAVQLREVFGGDAGARLGGFGSSVPLMQRNGHAVIVEEVADLDYDVQLRLLAFFTDSQPEKFWIFETSKDLSSMVRADRFLPSLKNLIGEGIVLPPVRVCKDRIPEEAERLISIFRERHGRDIGLERTALLALQDYDWPGNYREFRATIESAFLLSGGPSISGRDLNLGGYAEVIDADPLNLRLHIQDLERSLILHAYALHSGNQVQMARSLGISRGSLQYRLEKMGLKT